jgi:hypothetical protein
MTPLEELLAKAARVAAQSVKERARIRAELRTVEREIKFGGGVRIDWSTGQPAVYSDNVVSLKNYRKEKQL